jgi:MoaA/NifB/PqqE/SkfB family radical SAM enzyme
MKGKNISETLQTFGVKKALQYLDANPDENIPRLVDWVERFDQTGSISDKIRVVREAMENKQGNWSGLLKSLYDDIDQDMRKQLFENFIINTVVVGMQRQKTTQEKYGCNVPWAILMDPTSACNLHCKGCWAADYGNKLKLSLEEWESIIEQGKQMGTYMFLYSGGEPLMRKNDIVKMCEKHSDCVFLSFTNATLIDEEFANEILRVKNFIPAISVEGFAEETDFRRGKGTYDAVVRAMKILKNKKLPFGISCCYTSMNTEIIGSEEFIDDMIEQGAKFAWFFTYMPIGVDAVPELMVSAEQREFMYRQIRAFRNSKPIFTLDFWNDGDYVDGCIAGGRRYIHINANGDIEPCAFIHYSDSNIKEKTLLEAYQSPLFMGYRENQPFNNNHLRPCPLLDNPGRLTSIVEKAKARSTDLKNPEDVRALSDKCVKAAENWAITADSIWSESLR